MKYVVDTHADEMTNHSSIIARTCACLAVIVAVGLCSATPTHAGEAVPVVSIPSGQTQIDDIGWYGVSYRYTDGHAGNEPMGWTGMFDEQTGISALPAGVQNGKRAYLLHPIWHGGTGDTDQTYRIALPKATVITLAFSIAMRTDAVGKSDGATFRVFVDGIKLLDQNKTDGAWSDYSFDLSRYAGQTVTLVFEIDPGPREDPSFDFALWGDRRLTCTGGRQRSITRLFLPSNTPLDVNEVGWGGASPTDSVRSGSASKIAARAVLSPAGLFDGLSFDLGAGRPGLSLPFAQSAWLELVAPDGRIVSSESAEAHARVTQTSPSPGVIQRTAVYTLDDRTITVVAQISAYRASSVRVRLSSNDPYIAAVHFGRIGPAEFERQIVVPYYGTIGYAMRLGLFSNVVIDYGLSHATALTGEDVAEYRPLTDGGRIAVSETVYYALSPHARGVLPIPINGPSPYRQIMGGVVVNDYWGDDAPGLANTLQDLSTYGLTHFLTIVHAWQHGGYDQQLPSVLPANPSIGGNSGVIALTTMAKSLGEMVALHENYVDFYPNGPLYDPNNLALQPDGKPISAWMFPGHVSYVMTPVVMRQYAQQITTDVHRELGTNASYLDVHSAISPFVHTDARTGRKGAGEFITCLNAQRDLWQFMRDIHGGPVLGEGANHWYWSGMLDGVEAQFGVGVPSNAGEDAPLFVDFDLLKIHPRQTNHGMGYVSRWLTNESARPTQSELDEYRMQEVAYGHSAFVGTLELPMVWEEHNLVIPVASRYATAKVRSIAYEVGGVLRDTDDAVAAGADFRRVRVVYDNGLTVWANGRRYPWIVRNAGRSFDLPQFGWVAIAPGLTAYAATVSGRMATFAETPRSLFADARTALVSAASAHTGYASPRALDMAQTGPRRFQIRFAFDVNRMIPAGYRGFVHLVSDRISANEGIVTQFSLGIDSDPSSWFSGRRQAGSLVSAQLPAGVPAGVYDIRIGLFQPATGNRLLLNGVDDGSERYTVARIVVSNRGESIVATPIGPPASDIASQAHLVDFGAVATNGSVKLTRRRSGVWTLIPLPRHEAFQVEIDGRQLDGALAGHIRAVAMSDMGAPIGAPFILPKHAERSVLRVSLPSGAIGYKLTGTE